MELRDSHGNVALRIVDSKCYDIRGNWVYLQNGDYICNSVGNWVYIIRGDKVYDTQGNWVYKIHTDSWNYIPDIQATVSCINCGCYIMKDKNPAFCSNCGTRLLNESMNGEQSVLLNKRHKIPVSKPLQHIKNYEPSSRGSVRYRSRNLHKKVFFAVSLFGVLIIAIILFVPLEVISDAIRPRGVRVSNDMGFGEPSGGTLDVVGNWELDRVINARPGRAFTERLEFFENGTGARIRNPVLGDGPNPFEWHIIEVEVAHGTMSGSMYMTGSGSFEFTITADTFQMHFGSGFYAVYMRDSYEPIHGEISTSIPEPTPPPIPERIRIADDLNSAREAVRPFAHILATNGGGVGIATGFSIGLVADGPILTTGDIDNSRFQTEWWRDVIAIAAGDSHVVGLRPNGTVVADYVRGGSLLNRVSVWFDKHVEDSDPVVALAIILADGVFGDGEALRELYDITTNSASSHLRVLEWTDIVQVEAGGYQVFIETFFDNRGTTVGLRADGTVVAVGNNDYGQINVEWWENVVDISTSGTHTVGLLADGTVVATGRSSDGQLNVTHWTNIVAVSAGHSHTVGLRADGTVVVAGSNRLGGLDVGDMQNIIAISAGFYNVVGIDVYGGIQLARPLGAGRLMHRWGDLSTARGGYLAVSMSGLGEEIPGINEPSGTPNRPVNRYLALRADGTVLGISGASHNEGLPMQFGVTGALYNINNWVLTEPLYNVGNWSR